MSVKKTTDTYIELPSTRLSNTPRSIDIFGRVNDRENITLEVDEIRYKVSLKDLQDFLTQIAILAQEK